jgi:hypothetical protein
LFHDFGFEKAEMLPGGSHSMPPVSVMKYSDFRTDTCFDVRIRMLCGFPESGSAEIPFAHVDLTSRTDQDETTALDMQLNPNREEIGMRVVRKYTVGVGSIERLQNEGLC